jgi:RimJ/RimL family protein N-acetyltransferase
MNTWDSDLISASSPDAEQIGRLASDIWREVYPGIVTMDQIQYMLRQMYAPEVIRSEIEQQGIRYLFFRILGAQEGFAAYGNCGAMPIDNCRSCSDSNDAVMLHKLYLHPRRHGAGHGSRMLQLVEHDIAKEMPSARRIILRVNKENHKAIRAYERNGYQVAGTICSDIGEGFVMDDYWMTKALPHS